MIAPAPVITIDGPSGSGKGTVAGILAKRLGWNLLDSGALYRLLAFAATNHGVALDNEPLLEKLAAHLDVQFVGATDGKPARIILEGDEVTHAIRSETVAAGASKVAALPAVREALLQRQRAFQELPGLVADGRDMGTVVFPDAFLKIFLTAPAKERAKRRALQLGFNEHSSEYNRIYQQLLQRDARDQNRAISPLIPAKDAYLLDNSGLNIEQTVEKVLFYYQQANNRV